MAIDCKQYSSDYTDPNWIFIYLFRVICGSEVETLRAAFTLQHNASVFVWELTNSSIFLCKLKSNKMS